MMKLSNCFYSLMLFFGACEFITPGVYVHYLGEKMQPPWHMFALVALFAILAISCFAVAGSAQTREDAEQFGMNPQITQDIMRILS